MWDYIWLVIMGAIIGTVAKFIMPGKNEPQGFILTTILGVAGVLLATFLGQAVGWYGPGDGARWIGGIVGSLILLVVYGMVFKPKA
jgi:uncharacterized membrane protein YeaQ/YmgE (transglycosylase-associated protein family)